MDLNICIVHYNSSDTLPCLKSLAAQTVRAQVLLVNNASTDDSMQAIRTYAETSSLKIQLLDAPSNGGFATGNNIALNWAHQHTPQAWNLLLNNDTLLPEDFIEKLIAVAEELTHESAVPFALSASEYDYFQSHQRHSGMQYLSLPTGLSFNTPGLLRTPYLCGACILLDPKAPLLDEGYFLYYEDADYAKRLQAAGYRLLTTDETRYFHKTSATTALNPNILSIQMTSMWRYYKLHYPQWIQTVKRLRILEYFLLGRKNVVRIINQTYHQAHA